VLPDDAGLKTQQREKLLGGVTVIRGRATAVGYARDGKTLEKKQKDFVAIPYYAWAHRGAGEMAVWLARNESVVEPATPPGMIRNPSFEQVTGRGPGRVSLRRRRTHGQALRHDLLRKRRRRRVADVG